MYEQLEHSNQLKVVWEKNSIRREVDMLVVVDDVGASYTDFASSDAASLVYDKDADKTAYHLTMQVDPYIAILAGGDERLQPLVDVKMMVDPLDITVEQIKEHLAAKIMLGPNQKTHLMWWHYKKHGMVEVTADEDLMKVLRRKTLSRKVFLSVEVTTDSEETNSSDAGVSDEEEN